MIGLDTNVVIRYLVQDDPQQSALATQFIETVLSPVDPGFVTLVTLCEIGWVLSECYETDKRTLRAVIEGLLTSKQIVIQEAELVWKALRALDAMAADFSDALIGQVALAAGCRTVVTFDKGAAKLAGFELLR